MLLLHCTLQTMSATHASTTGHLLGQIVYAVLGHQVCEKKRGWGMADGHSPEQNHCSGLQLGPAERIVKRLKAWVGSAL